MINTYTKQQQELHFTKYYGFIAWSDIVKTIDKEALKQSLLNDVRSNFITIPLLKDKLVRYEYVKDSARARATNIKHMMNIINDVIKLKEGK